MTLCRWRDNYSGRIRRRRCSGTTRLGAWSCLDRDLACRLCNSAVRSGATSAPKYRRLFGYSWQRSIAKRPGNGQVSKGKMVPWSRDSVSHLLDCLTPFAPFVTLRADSAPGVELLLHINEHQGLS